VTSRDKTIYVYDVRGNIKWTYDSRSPYYGIIANDVDDNTLTDFMVFSTSNITRLEANEYYIKKFNADSLYNLANDNFLIGDHTTASIYLEKARKLYTEINDRDSFAKVEQLESRIMNERLTKFKQEADRYYTQALNYYALNDLKSSIDKIEQAQQIFIRIGDQGGIEKCEKLRDTIEEERRNQKIIEADGTYLKAVTLSNFNNITGAIELIRRAKQTYESLDYKNGTAKANLLLVTIADRQYKVAKASYESGDYEKAMSYSEFAKMIYEEAGYVNASITADGLYTQANESLHNPPETEPEGGLDTMTIIAILSVVTILFALAMRFYRPKKRKRQPRESIDEELASLEAEEEFR